MAHPSQSTQPSPAPFFAACNALFTSAAIKSAIELDVFTAIAEGALTPAALAEKCRATERGMRILCDYLTVHGFLTKAEDHYGLTQDSAVFLNQHSPAYVGAAVKFLLREENFRLVQNLTPAIRTGLKDDSPLSSDHPMWVEFARSMAPFVGSSAGEIAELVEQPQQCRVLDIAAGHGLFGIALAQRNPGTRVTAMDWPHVLDVAWENARGRGLADRYNVIPGSAFEADWGSGYDIVLLTNFLHHFDRAGCASILAKAHAALKPGGRVVTLEFVPNQDRVSPPLPAQFAMIMLTTTPAGDAYTYAELASMFADAGFASSEQRPLTRSVQSIVISTK
jgi:2-polyprenyl-3-methyl-5-hydroxy-6-metoxy-1,4-benzoquinol methylase